MDKPIRHYEENVLIATSADEVFSYVDDFNNFSSHMNKSSWMMGGGKMETKIDEGKGQKVGSHIQMTGKVFGVSLFLDEVIMIREVPFRKEWQTVGNVNLVVIDQYTLGFNIKPENNNSRLKVFIDYGLPKSFKTYLLGTLFGEMYAKWCVRQMIKGVQEHFK